MRVYGRPRRNRTVLLRRWIAAALMLAIAGYAAAQLIPGGGTPATKQAFHHRTQTTPSTTPSRSSPTSTTQPPPSRSAPPGQPVPILMYHVIADPPPGATYPDLYLSPALFTDQLRYLHHRGFHAVTLNQVWRYWHHHLRIPQHPIVLSFDDGYLSQYSVASRLLAHYHWPAVLNLAVDHLHMGSYGLTQGRVKKMIANGWEIDSHTIDHLDVTTLDTAGLHKEIADSRVILRRLFHQPVNFFCYPAGKYDTTAITAVRNAGYLAATTTNEGIASPTQNPYQLDRIRIHGAETTTQLAANLNR